jgi:NAD(P)-dependent dehydrogenase (short-subunit alcohol dehydrogenase family)
MMTPGERFSLAGKNVLLTGAAGGIGMALLEGLIEAGARVIASTRHPDTDWRGLDKKFGGQLVPVVCELADQEQIKVVIKVIEEEYAGCDVLINNASDCPHPKENYYDLQALNHTMKVTLDAAYLLCGEIAPQMAGRGHGSIINVTSINAELAWPGSPAYITSKSALRMLTRAVARDFGAYGVRANNLSPGYVHTRMTDGSFNDPAMYEERRSHTMLGRWANLDDLVGPCIFLASDASAYVTGVDLHVDGGWLAKGM